MAVLEPIRNSIKYIAELFKILDYDPRLAIADSVFGRQYNIYAFSVAPLIVDPDNYWIVWGGWFDNPVGYGIQIYMDVFLTEVFDEASLISTENCFYINTDTNILYMNIPLKPWQFSKAFSGLYDNTESTFSSAPKNSANFSDIFYGNIRTYPRMKVPSFDNKLNDVISGVIVYNDFSIDVDNSDGEFDGLNIIDYFNTPIQISKTSDGDNATTLEDFNRIRYGLVQDISVVFKNIQIKGVDQFYLMNKDFCRKFTADDYPNIPDNNINNDIPVLWGTASRVAMFEVNKDTVNDPPEWIDYIAVDPAYVTAVSKVYDTDGNELTFSFDGDTGIIRVTELDGDGEVIEAECADATGKTDCRLGKVIIDALSSNENIFYVEGIWDITETDLYLDICPDVGFYFDGGTTRELVEAVFKNDNAFLIQKHNGLLTLRRWGETYQTHTIPSYLVTQKPKKDFKDASKHYCSTVRILSDKNHNTDNFFAIYIDKSREAEIFEAYRRSFTADFETDLIDDDDIADLAERLLERFGQVRETLRVGFGVDTFEINLLDTIQFEALINDRAFSEYSTWIVKECDPGQDELTIEGLEIYYAMSFDGVAASLDLKYWGYSKDQITI
jgi:hypothetical protein